VQLVYLHVLIYVILDVDVSSGVFRPYQGYTSLKRYKERAKGLMTMFTPKFVFPDDPFEMFHGGSAFAFEGWQGAIGERSVFRVSGVTDVIDSLSTEISGRKYIEYLKVIGDDIAERRAPQVWRDNFSVKNAWVLGAPQINQNLRESEPQTFDKALLSVVYVAEFIERVLHEKVPKTFLKDISIVPVMYELKTPKKLWDEEIKGKSLRKKLREQLGISTDNVLIDAFEKRLRLTWNTASTLCAALADEGFEAEIVCTTGRKPKASNNERLTEARKAEDVKPVADFLRRAKD